MLKCPKCKRKSANKFYSFNPKIGRRYHQKYCRICGYESPKRYFGIHITQDVYNKEQEAIHNEITKRLEDID